MRHSIIRHSGLLFACVMTATVTLFTLLVFQSAESSRQAKSDRQTDSSARAPLSPRDLASNLQGDEYDVQDYRIDITLSPDSAYIEGNVKIEYVAGTSGVNTFEFNLDQPLLIDSLTAPVPIYEYTHLNDVVSVFLDTTISAGDTSTVTVYYRGVPPPPTQYGTLYFNSHGSGPVIYSISWPDNARSWWPCKDDIRDKGTATIIVTVPNDLVVASNGNLMGIIDNGDGTYTHTWRESYPVTTYNICIAISNYEVFTQYFKHSPTDSMPLPFYVWPEDRADAEEDWEQVWEMTAFYDSLFGEYPFILEKYGMAETSTNPFAAMEHQTITSWGDVYITGDHQWDDIVTHEIAHSWWGNSVTPAVWEEIWLSEGFSTYSEALWREYQGGLGDYLAYMGVLDSGNFPGTVYDPVDLLGETVYNKGAWVVHMLRWVVGDSAFFEILPAFANDPGFKYGHASTLELITLCEGIAGIELNWFFDQWVYEGGRPHYLLNWDASDTSSSWEVTVFVDQVQPGEEIFIMPLELLFVSGTDSVWERINDFTGNYQGTFDLAWEPENVSLDPRGWVLKILKYPVEITTTELADGFVGAQYFAVLRAQGGIGNTIWSIESGQLPDGLELNTDNGLISGVPAVADSFAFLARVTDDYDPAYYDEAWLSILIHPPSGIEGDETGGLPSVFGLEQNFPNPFNAGTQITFDLIDAGDVSLSVYNLLGQEVAALVNGTMEAGRHVVSFSANNLPSGLYLYRMETNGFTAQKKMILMK